MDRCKILTHGRKVLGLKLHIWRVTADVAGFREFLAENSNVDDYWLDVRKIVELRQDGGTMFV